MRRFQNFQRFTFCLLIIVGIGQTPWAADFLPYEIDRSVPGLRSVGLGLAIDFVLTPDGQMKVLEFGTVTGSAFEGHEHAFPGRERVVKSYLYSIPQAYAQTHGWSLESKSFALQPSLTFSTKRMMVNVWSAEQLLSEKHHVWEHNPKAMVYNICQPDEWITQTPFRKIFSLLLFDRKALRFAPTTLALSSRSSFMGDELQKAIDEFPTELVILKRSGSTRGEDIFVTSREAFVPFFRMLSLLFQHSSWVVQSYHPGKVGRAAFSFFYDRERGRATLYPLTLYWKHFDQALAQLPNGFQVLFRDKTGTRFAPEEEALLLAQLREFAPSIFFNMAAFNQVGMKWDPLTATQLTELQSLDSVSWDTLTHTDPTLGLHLSELAYRSSVAEAFLACSTHLKNP